jgi:ABC-type lipoprotein release transport system permease subunit
VLRLATRNLARHRWRTLIVGSGTALGVAAVVIQSGLVGGVERQMVDELVVSQFGHVAIAPAGAGVPADAVARAAVPRIADRGPLEAAVRAALPGARVAPALSSLGMAFGGASDTARIALQGVAPDDEPLVEALHRRTADGATVLGPGFVYLGSALAERLQVAAGDGLTLCAAHPDGSLDAVDFEVARVLGAAAPWQDYFVYLALEDLQALTGVGEAVDLLKVRLDGGTAAAPEAAARLAIALADRGDVRVETYREQGAFFLGIVTAARVQAGVVGVVLLVAAALGVAGAQVLAVHERRREIGTMAALGTSRRLIRIVFLAEGAVLAAVAGTVGALAGAAVIRLLRSTGIGMGVEAFEWMVGGPRLVPWLDAWSVAWTLGEAILAVSLAGLYPALRASRLPPVEAMR